MNSTQRSQVLSRIASLVLDNTDFVREGTHFTKLPYGEVKPPKTFGADPSAYIRYIYAEPTAIDGDGAVCITTSTHYTDGKVRSFSPILQDYDITDFGDKFIERVLEYLEARDYERIYS